MTCGKVSVITMVVSPCIIQHHFACIETSNWCGVSSVIPPLSTLWEEYDKLVDLVDILKKRQGSVKQASVQLQLLRSSTCYNR